MVTKVVAVAAAAVVIAVAKEVLVMMIEMTVVMGMKAAPLKKSWQKSWQNNLLETPEAPTQQCCQNGVPNARTCFSVGAIHDDSCTTVVIGPEDPNMHLQKFLEICSTF